MLKLSIGLLVAVGLFAISWGLFVGMMYLISLCFGLSFDLLMATGVWLVLCLYKLVFRKKSKK